jgi:hypothetical protein
MEVLREGAPHSWHGLWILWSYMVGAFSKLVSRFSIRISEDSLQTDVGVDG